MPLELGPIFRFETRRLVAKRAWYLVRILLLIVLAGQLASVYAVYSSWVSLDSRPGDRFFVVADYSCGLYGAFSLFVAFAIAPLAAVASLSGSRGKYMLPLLLVTRLSGRE